jgi:uncharacterized protein YdhG (YjbR/CyaY superfamily)
MIMVGKDKRAEGEAAVKAVIDGMPDEDKIIAERLHFIIIKNAPSLIPRTWYGLPAYGDENGKVLCFFRSTNKFGERYMTLGFNDSAKLDTGNMWPISFAIKNMVSDVEVEIAEIVNRAIN